MVTVHKIVLKGLTVLQVDAQIVRQVVLLVKVWLIAHHVYQVCTFPTAQHIILQHVYRHVRQHILLTVQVGASNVQVLVYFVIMQLHVLNARVVIL